MDQQRPAAVYPRHGGLESGHAVQREEQLDQNPDSLSRAGTTKHGTVKDFNWDQSTIRRIIGMTEKIWVAIISAAGAIAVAGINCYASCHRDNARLGSPQPNAC